VLREALRGVHQRCWPFLGHGDLEVMPVASCVRALGLEGCSPSLLLDGNAGSVLLWWWGRVVCARIP
jgi:hypothetical protein